MKKLLLIAQCLLVVFFANGQTNGDWTELGPKDFPAHLNWQISGVARISQMKFHPTDPNTLYAVNAMGGLFISRDKGANWVGTGADKLPQTRCASVCIDHTDDRVLYLGTGDPSYYSDGLGIWKSTDGGNSWAQSNSGMGNRLAVEILMAQSDRNILLAATRDGLWKSINAGATWTVKKAGGDFTDMVFRAGVNQTTLYATTRSEFWRSEDMGETWTKITLPGNGLLNGGRVAVSKADQNIVYVTFVGDHGAGTDTPVLKSTDNGKTFSSVRNAGQPNLNGYGPTEGGQGNYNYGLSVNPNNANHLMIVGHIIWVSTNGGVNWSTVSVDWAHQVHTDMRQTPFSPYNNNEIYNINDGGIWHSWDNGTSWLPLCNGLVGTESYVGCQSPIKKESISIGAQDNGEYVYSAGIWYINGAGDFHDNIIQDNISAGYYYNFSGAGARRNLPYGGSTTLNLPFNAGNGQSVIPEFPIANTQVAFLGYKEVWRTTNVANNPPTWTAITAINRQVRAVTTSPTDANVLYVVTDDGIIRRSDNALAATPAWNTYNTPSATNVTASVVVVKGNTNIVYLACNNKVYRSADRGANWADVTGNLPNVNYHKLLHDNYSTNEAIYVAGYNSVLYRDNTTGNWVNFSKGLPTVANFQRIYMYNDGTDNSELTIISAGRGVWHTGLYGKSPVLRTPENPEAVIPGVVYQYYEQTWDHLPNFNSFTPQKMGAVDVPNIAVRQREDNFGLAFDGFIDIPTDGKYTFYTTSDDGTKFFIGNEMVVSNDGVHGDQEASGYMWLKKGKHKFSLNYFQGIGGKSLSLSYSGPGIAKQIVPASVLYRLSPMSVCDGNGSISVEKWTNVGGTTVANIPVGAAANLTYTNPNFESKTDDGDNYGVRYRGYICPPYTGSYTFYVASDDDSELWLSTTGSPANKVKIAFLSGSVNQRNWYLNASQKSAKIQLKAGQKYYIEALHKEGGGGDHFAVACVLPSGEFQAPLSGNHLSPFKNNAFPTVALTAPADNYTALSGTNVTVSANAADTDGTIARVEFYLDDIKVAEDASSPYSWTWASTSQQQAYSLTARAVDNAGGVAVSASQKATILDLRNPENPPLTKPGLDYKYYEGAWTALPNFAILNPVKSGTVLNFDIAPSNVVDNFGFVFTGFIDIKEQGIFTFFSASDDGSKLFIGNMLVVNNDGLHGVGTETNGAIALKVGKHAITVQFFDATVDNVINMAYQGPSFARKAVPSDVLFRSIATNTAPSVSVTSNSLTATAPANLTLTATASDADGTIAKVEFYANTALLSTSTSAPYTYAWNNVAVGTYTVLAKAYDDNNAVTSSTTISVNVKANQLPTVSITSPANNATFNEPASINIQANAADTDGTIAKVEFYNGTIKLGEDTSSPYAFNWTAVANGTYTISAKAYDNLNALQTSAAIMATVSKVTSLDTISALITSNELTLYPNPVYSTATIEFDLVQSSEITISVYDIEGRILNVLDQKYLEAGHYQTPYNFSNLTTGTYVLKLVSNQKAYATKLFKAVKPKKD